MIWFKADSNFLQTHEADCLMFEFGMDAIGLYWSCCGLVASAITPDNICFEIKHTPEQLAYKFHMDVERLKLIFERFVSLQLFYKENNRYSIPALVSKLDEFTKKSARKEKPESGQTPDTLRTDSGVNPDMLRTDSGQTPERIDKNRIDKNREDEKGEKPKANKFTPPLPPEVQAYLDERKVTKFTAQKFIDHYAARGWMIGKNKMKDWKAAVRTWEQNDFNNATGPPGPQPSRYKEFTTGDYEQ